MERLISLLCTVYAAFQCGPPLQTQLNLIITNLASAFLFSDERGGWAYLDRLAYLVQEYCRTRPPTSKSIETATVSDKMDSHTVWGIYNIATFVSAAPL